MRAALPFAALLAVSGPSAAAQDPSGTAWSSVETVEIKLFNYRFMPDTLTLRQGQAYRLHLVNAGGDHSFSAPEFFAAAQIAPEDAGAIAKGEVELADGETRDIRVIPQRAGAYDFRCTHFLHAPMGMRGRITVQ